MMVANSNSCVLVDLEQFVARIGVERVHQRLAGMALRVEPGAPHHLGDLLRISGTSVCGVASDIEVKSPRMRSSPDVAALRS